MFSKKNLILMFTLLAVLFTSVCIPGVSAGTSAEVSPVMSVDYISLSFRDSVYIKYAVYTDGADAKLLIWNGEQSEYTEGTHTAEVVSETTQKIGNKTYAIFDYTGVTAKQMADVFYARAYVQEGDKEYYSPVCKYSVLNYAYSILGKTGTASADENLKTLMSSMLAYGASAQTYLNYKTDRLATMDFYQVKVVGGTLTDTTDRGFYRPDDQVTMIAPAVDASGVPFAGWKNSNGEIVSTDLTYTAKAGLKNEVYTATYGVVVKTYSVTFVDYDGKVLKTETVESGKAATAPADPSRAGYIFIGWDTKFDNVTSDLVVTATYKADSKPTIYVKDVTVAPGQTSVNVELCVRNNPGVAGATVKVSYDGNLTLKSASNGEAFSALQYSAPGKFVSPCNFTWDSETGETQTDGTILNLTFDIPSNAASGDVFEISCSYRSGDIFNDDWDDVDFNLVNGKITVK